MVHLKNPLPIPIQAKYDLRRILISQFLKERKNSSYKFMDKDGSFMAEFQVKPSEATAADDETNFLLTFFLQTGKPQML